jgi:cytosine/adenosine deaminase-related metal-dependent hydrolase
MSSSPSLLRSRTWLLGLTGLGAGTLVACGDNAATTPPIDGGVEVDAALPPDASPDASPMSVIVQCEADVPTPAAGICAGTPGAGSAVALRGTVLGDGTTYLDGEVVYDGAEIVCVGCDCADAPGRDTASVIDCGDAVISPGLINAHDHLNYNDRSPLASTALHGERFDHRHDWRGEVSTPSNQYGTGATSNGMRLGELRQLMTGTTSMAASTRASGLVRNLDELESADLDQGFESTTYEVFALGDGNETFHDDCDWNYEWDEFEVSLMHSLVTHTAEGITSYAHDEFFCQSRSYAGAEDFTERNVAHIHGIGLFTSDYFNMARDDAKLIWSPRSNVSLYGMTAAAPALDRFGGTVAVGTDWTYSGSASVTRELQCVADLNAGAYAGYFSDEDIWQMATKNAAIATGAQGRIGRLAPELVADIAIFAAEPGELHAAVIGADTQATALVIKAGAVMYGEPGVVAALGESCDPVDVCGEDRRVCLSREASGQTFAQLAAATPAAYPMIICGTPDDEPSCLPERPGSYAGPTAGDDDGDGLPNATDLCPTVFDPIRPIDAGQQADNDDDGLGDACDPSPLAIDLDGDGVLNDVDNCPFLSNAGQDDEDNDDKGDACDACPTTPNPDGVCGPATVSIVDIRSGAVALDTAVTVSGAVVTGVADNGFAMQDPTVATGINAGIFVFTDSAPGVEVGDVVTVAGATDRYFDQDEIVGTVVSATAGTPITPISLTVAQAATEPYESVLVTLTDVTTVDNPYDCAADVAICDDSALWELNDTIVAYDQFYQDADWAAEASAAGAGTDVTGVMFFRFERRRICPRTAADITP